TFAEKMDGFPEDLNSHLARIEDVAGRVGRVELINHRLVWAGTGWRLEERLVITNRHVAEIFAGRRSTGGFTFFRHPGVGASYGARIDFRQEFERTNTAWAQVAKIRYIAGPGEPDIALLELAAGENLPEPVPLADGEARKGALIGVMGYPAYDSRNDANDI